MEIKEMALSVDIIMKRQKFCLAVKFEAKEEIMGVLGASGCGKSMTLKCIAGIEKPDSGKIILNGRTLFDAAKKINLPPQERSVGYLFQNYALFPHMTVEENILAGIRQKDKQAQLARYSKIFYLTGLEKRYPKELSGGQQQRVALARIFASEPEIMMLDEPFSALDSYLKWQVELELADILKEYQNTVLFVSHNRDEVYRFCDRVAVISQGNLECVSTKEAVFHNPETLAAAKLTGCKNHSRIERLSNDTVEAIDWGLTLRVTNSISQDVSYIGIRAHDLKLANDETVENTFEFEIVQCIEDTFSFILMVKHQKATLGNNALLRVEVSKEIWRQVSCDRQRIYLTLPEEKLFLLKA
ncbi:MAG: ATP-binding cassette domain-containing protein [Pelosinus sp.]|nr:ATP-binding cassette domain-containing protein [Pelosinus sp.]